MLSEHKTNMFCCNWCIYLLISIEKQRLSGFQLACFHKSLLSASQTTWRFSLSPFTVTTVSNKHKHLSATLSVFNMEMSLHSHFISVKRLRIEKGTSDDAEKFEAVADTGKWNYYIIFHSLIIWVSFTWIIVCFRVWAHREQPTG